MTAPGRPRARRAVRAVLLGLATALALTASGCSRLTPPSADPVRTTVTRPAASHSCTVAASPQRVLALPRVDAQTLRVAPHVVGEKVTWGAGSRTVVAWVGIDALGVFQDLDLVPAEVPGSASSRLWTTSVRPGLVVVQGDTGHRAPCDLLFLSTEGVRPGAAVRAVAKLRIASRPAGSDPGGGDG